MPLTNQTDDIEEMGSSTINEDPDAVVAAADGAAAANAGSSTANDDNDDGLLGVVRDVVKDRATPDAAASSADGTEGGLDADGKPLPTGPDNETFSDVPFHKHPRFQEVITQRNSFREDAGRYRNVVEYLDANNLNAEEASNALATFARAKVDPAGAFAELKPWLQKLLVAAGEVLPDDLQARVTAGEMTAEVALEVSRERSKVKSFEAKTGFEAQRAARTSQTNLVQQLVTTADDWARDRRVKDPNFAAKEPLLMREIAYLQSTEGKPKDAAGVSAQLKKAYDAVNKSFKAPAAAAPAARKPAIKPVVNGTVNGTVREKPKTTLDIVRANRRQKTG